MDLENEASIYQYSKGFRFGNPIYVGQKKSRILCFVIDREAPITYGQANDTMMERLGMAVGFANRKVRFCKEMDWHKKAVHKGTSWSRDVTPPLRDVEKRHFWQLLAL